MSQKQILQGMSQNQIFCPSTLMYADQKYLNISILERKI